MSSFNLFDEKSWETSVRAEDIEKKIRNKALGQIGQLISEIRDLKEAVEKKNNFENNAQYVAAKQLSERNNVAFKQMQINFIYPDNDVAKLLKVIDDVLNFWKDKVRREYAWKSIIPSLKELKPYLRSGSSRHFFYGDDSTKNIKALVDVKVVGNAAWEEYFKQYTQHQYWNKAWQELDTKIKALSEQDDLEDVRAEYDDE